MRKNDKFRFAGSFTVEAAFVMSIVLLSIATTISFCFSKRDEVFKNYVVQSAAEDAANIEETWLPKESNLDNVTQRTDDRLHIIGNLSELATTAMRDDLKGKAHANVADEQYTENIVNIENYMRYTTVIEDFVWKEK